MKQFKHVSLVCSQVKLLKEQTFFLYKGERGFVGTPGFPGLAGSPVSVVTFMSHFKVASICTHRII